MFQMYLNVEPFDFARNDISGRIFASKLLIQQVSKVVCVNKKMSFQKLKKVLSLYQVPLEKSDPWVNLPPCQQWALRHQPLCLFPAPTPSSSVCQHSWITTTTPSPPCR